MNFIEDYGINVIPNNYVIVIYDDGLEGHIRELNSEIPLDFHAARVANVSLKYKNCILKDFGTVLSVSYKDCMRFGYDKVKRDIVNTYGPVLIEVHAYSANESSELEIYHEQLESCLRNLDLKSFILCSPGHTFNHMRFPATVKGVYSVGLLATNGTVIGQGCNGLLSPTFLLPDMHFSIRGYKDVATESRGTSFALGYVAALAAKAAEKISGHKLDSAETAILASLIMISKKIGNSYLIEDESLLWSSIELFSPTRVVTLERKLLVKFCRNSMEESRLAIVARGTSSSDWLPTPPQIQIFSDSSQIVLENGSAVVQFNKLNNNDTVMLEILITGLCTEISIVSVGGEIEIDDQILLKPKMPGDVVIVGISASHDASACVLVNDKISCAIQLERLSRAKHDGELYLHRDQAISYCLDSIGLALADVDYFAFNIQSLTPEYVGLSQPVFFDFKTFDPFSDCSIFVSHHLCHAFAGISNSNYNEPTVVVADGSGGTVIGKKDIILPGPELHQYLMSGMGLEREPSLHTFSVYKFKKDSYSLLYREVSPSFNTRSGSSSIGETYAAVSQYVFGSWQASGKLMGLAPYGDASSAKKMMSLDDNLTVNYGYLWKLDVSNRDASKGVMQYADLAAATQSVLEAALESRFSLYVGQIKEVVFTGGVALNSAANHKIRNKLSYKDFHLFPAQHDAGVSIGPALAAYYHLKSKVLTSAISHDYLGHVYGVPDVIRSINKFSRRIRVRPVSTYDIALMLADGDVLGYYSLDKGSEFGPRSLGARSILADPRSKSTWRYINKWVKFREDFRPFAPVITRESVFKYFEVDDDFPYMLEVVHVRKEFHAELAAVTHVDGTARLQTVTADMHSALHELLLEFQEIAGIPILLNTSFNVRGQPIIETPEQAIEMLLSTHLSGVVFGEYLVEPVCCSAPMSGSTILSLSPGTSLEKSIRNKNTSRRILIGSQGKIIELPVYLFEVLEKIDGETSLGLILDGIDLNDVSRITSMMERFVRLKYLNTLAC